jgi:hypothetical protein
MPRRGKGLAGKFQCNGIYDPYAAPSSKGCHNEVQFVWLMHPEYGVAVQARCKEHNTARSLGKYIICKVPRLKYVLLNAKAVFGKKNIYTVELLRKYLRKK